MSDEQVVAVKVEPSAGKRLRVWGVLLGVAAVVAGLALVPSNGSVTLAWLPAAGAFGAFAGPASVLYGIGRLLDFLERNRSATGAP